MANERIVRLHFWLLQGQTTCRRVQHAQTSHSSFRDLVSRCPASPILHRSGSASAIHIRKAESVGPYHGGIISGASILYISFQHHV